LKIINSDISRDAKEEIVRHYMLPTKNEGYPSEVLATLEKTKEKPGKVGIARP